MKKIGYFILAVSLILASCSRDPVADFFTSRNTVDVGEVVYFTNNSYDADYYEWDFGDGTRTNGFDAEHAYTQAGDFTVSLFAFNGDRVDKAFTTITVFLPPVSLEVIVLEYYDEYAVANASVVLYNTLDDWDEGLDNFLVEEITDQNGEAIFDDLDEQRYYIDVLEEYHNNYDLGLENEIWIETHVLLPGENFFYAYVDYVEPEPGMKSSAVRGERVMKIRNLEKVDRRMFEEKQESIRKKIEERKLNEEQPKMIDEIKK